MKILVIGAGISGCSISRLLSDRGHNISLIEKSSSIGGLCVTRISPNGIPFEPFGARTFHSHDKQVLNFIQKFGLWNHSLHRKGIVLDDKVYPYPISLTTVRQLPQRHKIMQELKSRPKRINNKNFETAAISIFGKTLYGLFIEPYTRKMWGKEPHLLDASWVENRIGLRANNRKSLFNDEWQGFPEYGYSKFLEEMVRGIPIKLNTSHFRRTDFDLIVSTAPIDEFFGYRFGRLEYRSIKFSYKQNERWENDRFGTINLPQNPNYIRKCNFKIMHRIRGKQNYIQYQKPCAVGRGAAPMYPVYSSESLNRFDAYLKTISATNIIPAGRLGLFAYLNMDRSVKLSFKLLPLIECYSKLKPEERYNRLNSLRNSITK